MAQLIRPFSTTLLLICSLSLSIATAATDDNFVLDVDGNPLEVGSAYYVRTELSKIGIGGGIFMASKPNQPQCPQYVAQFAVGWYGEIPITFLPSDPSQKYISISSDLNIVFNTTSSVCPQGAWQLTPDANSGMLFLSTGGVIGNPSSQTTANWLKVDRSSVDAKFYQLGYCPSSGTVDASSTSDIVCGVIDAIETSDDSLLVWLGLSPDPNPNFFHLLSFIKA